MPLLKLLEKKPLIMHGADYDLRLLYKGYKFRPRQLFDTMLAGKLLGEESCGLASLCESYLGIHRIRKRIGDADLSLKIISAMPSKMRSI